MENLEFIGLAIYFQLCVITLVLAFKDFKK